MWRMMLPKARHLVALAIFLPALVALLYFTEQQSDSYEAAEKFISTDNRVQAVVGTVTKVGFRFWDGYQAVSSANGGEATYSFDVSGRMGAAVIEVHLRSSLGVWNVIAAYVHTADGTTARIVGRWSTVMPLKLAGLTWLARLGCT